MNGALTVADPRRRHHSRSPGARGRGGGGGGGATSYLFGLTRRKSRVAVTGTTRVAIPSEPDVRAGRRSPLSDEVQPGEPACSNPSGRRLLVGDRYLHLADLRLTCRPSSASAATYRDHTAGFAHGGAGTWPARGAFSSDPTIRELRPRHRNASPAHSRVGREGRESSRALPVAGFAKGFREFRRAMFWRRCFRYAPPWQHDTVCVSGVAHR